MLLPSCAKNSSSDTENTENNSSQTPTQAEKRLVNVEYELFNVDDTRITGGNLRVFGGTAIQAAIFKLERCEAGVDGSVICRNDDNKSKFEKLVVRRKSGLKATTDASGTTKIKYQKRTYEDGSVHCEDFIILSTRKQSKEERKRCFDDVKVFGEYFDKLERKIKKAKDNLLENKTFSEECSKYYGEVLENSGYNYRVGS
jgi:hypothetical protein